MIARKLYDSPYPAAKFNQHVVLPHLFPECQPKGGFPVDTDVMNEDGMTDIPGNGKLPDDHLTTNDASPILPDADQPDVNMTIACSRDKRQGLKSENDALGSEVDGGSTASNSVCKYEGSIKLEVRD